MAAGVGGVVGAGRGPDVSNDVSPNGPSLRAVATRAGGGGAALDAVADHVTPVVMAGDRCLDVSPALAYVLPHGLQRGSTIGVRGPAALSLALAVAAGPVASGAWMAALGCDDLSLVGAEQAGVALHRLIVVAEPQRSAWGAVAAALVDAFDVVVVGASYGVAGRDARRLLSRARERGGIIIDVADCWPEAHDVVLDVAAQSWSGLGDGYGTLEARRVEISVAGRRGVRPRMVPLWLPGPSATPEGIDPADGRHAGSDVDRLEELEELERRDEQGDVGLRSVG